MIGRNGRRIAKSFVAKSWGELWDLGSVILFEFIGVADYLNQSLDGATQFGLAGGLQAF